MSDIFDKIELHDCPFCGGAGLLEEEQGWCKDDMVEQKVPCIIQVPVAVHNDSFDESFDHWVGAKDVNKFYFGMTLGTDSFTVVKYENHINKENKQCD